MAFYQILPTFRRASPLTHSAINLQLLARRLGRFGRLYAEAISPEFEPLTEPLATLDPAPDDLLVYHSIAVSPAHAAFLQAKARKGVVFHRTPLVHYQDERVDDTLAQLREEQRALAEQAEFTIILSEQDRKHAEAAGFANVHLVPRFIEPERYTADGLRREWIARMRQRSPNIVFHGELYPHERVERLIEIHREVLRLRPQARLLAIASEAPNKAYSDMLFEAGKSVGGIHPITSTGHREIVSALQAGDVCISASKMPRLDKQLEVLAAGLPLLVADGTDYAKLAATAVALAEDGPARERQLALQAKVLRGASSAVAGEAMRALLHRYDPPRKQTRKKTKKPRIAVVIQRYGDVIGGGERLTGEVVRQLAPHWNITVLTSCAQSYVTWANEFPPGEGVDPQAPGVKVLRFPVVRERIHEVFQEASTRVYRKQNDLLSEELWAAAQGPYAPGMFEHIERHVADYDGFLFFTYLYAQSLLGLPLVADRALLVPTAHDELPIALHMYKDVFERAQKLLLLTPEEGDIIARYHPRHAPMCAIGTGIDIPERMDPARFRAKFGIDRPYVIYVGRIETPKGVGELIEFLAELRKRDPEAPDLVLAGEQLMPLEGDGVHHVGRIDEQDKWDALAGAVATAVPSRYESLSLLALEGLAAGAPILVNAGSEVLQGHVDRSRAGASYTDFESFAAGLAAIAKDRKKMSARGKTYAAGYTWPNVVEIYREEMAKIVRR
jgi:glycosyltransferase involved in cell wall biosynthesis